MNNSTREHDTGQVTRLGLPAGGGHAGPGFAIPLVSFGVGANAQYVQRVNSGGKIIGFDLLDDVAVSVPLSGLQSVNVGDDEIYAIVDPEGRPHTGTQRELTPLVRNWVHGVQWPLLRMSFARFCGQKDLAEQSAREAVTAKSTELKDAEHATLWFIDSVILAGLLRTLSQARGSLASRTKLDVFSQYAVSVVRDKSGFAVELPSDLLESALSKQGSRQIKDLLDLAHSATGMRLDVRSASSQRSSGRTTSVDELHDRANSLKRRIEMLPRQEARLATLVEAILVEPPLGLLALKTYRDKGKFTRNVVAEMRGSAINSAILPDAHIEEALSGVLRRAIKDCYPLQKARLLLELSKVLARFPLVASLIRETVIQSNSRNVKLVRREILDNIERASGDSNVVKDARFFAEHWISANVHNIPGLEDYDAHVAQLTEQMIVDAEEKGIEESDLHEAIGDPVDYITEAYERVQDGALGFYEGD